MQVESHICCRPEMALAANRRSSHGLFRPSESRRRLEIGQWLYGR